MRKVYLQVDKDIDATITELERLQPIQLESLNSPSKHCHQAEDRSGDHVAIDAELTNEMNGLEQRHNRAMQKLKNNASSNIDHSINLLKNCKTDNEARNVLESLLNHTLGKLF